MRPRCLIDLIAHCRGFAINRGHEVIEVEDIGSGLHAFSTNLLTELGLEIRDVFPDVQDVLYAFIDSKTTMSLQDVRAKLHEIGVKPTDTERLVEILIWFGFFGVAWNGETKFIYTVNYDMKLIRAFLRGKADDSVLLIVNPAFVPGLAIST